MSHSLCRCLLSSLLFWLSSCYWLGIVSPSTSVGAAEATTADVPSTNGAFRRLFVPADAPETWPVGSERFLPIPHADFLRFVRQNEDQASRQHQRPVPIRHCTHRAKLLPGDVLRGSTEWTVELLGKQPQLLPLSPMNFAIESVFWRRDPTQAALLGLWKRKHFPGEKSMLPAVLVEQTDTLVMQWQLAAHKSARKTGVVHADYFLQKPIAVPQRLELDLPANHSASLVHAQLLRIDSGSHGRSHWVFQLAPHENHRLRIQGVTTTPAAQAIPFISQATSYQLHPSGLNVLTRLRLDARASPLAELKATLAAGLRVVAVSIDQQPVAWRVVDGAVEGVVDDGEVMDGNGQSALFISRPASQQPQSVVIECLAKIKSDAVTPWELPKLRFDEVAWTEGTTSLLVAPGLELHALIPRQATLQHIVGIADPAREGEVFRLQEWSRDAQIAIRVGRPQPRLAVQTLTTIELGRLEAQASFVAKLSSTRGEIYLVHATIVDPWSIDSVSATPKNAISEWHIDRQTNVAQLVVQFKRPISNQQPVRLEIKARKMARGAVLPATVGQLKLLRFLDADLHGELLQLRTLQSEHLLFASRLEQRRLSPEKVSETVPPAFRELLSEAPMGTLLDVATLDLSEVIALRPQPAQFETDLQMEVEAFPDSVKQSYQIRCQPRSGAMTELAIELDVPLPETTQWTFAKQQGKVTMQRLGPTVEDPLLSSPVRYVLRFPTAMTGDFLLQTSYSEPAKPLERCNLLRLPQFPVVAPVETPVNKNLNRGLLDWSGQVVLRGALSGFQILDQGWTPTVRSRYKVEQERLPMLGTYQLTPAAIRRGNVTTGLRLRRQTSALPAPSLIAWLAEYDTLQAANGAALHTASYSLENLGASEATIILPSGAQLQEAWLGEQTLELTKLASEGNAYLFRFGGERRWPLLVLKYSTQTSPLGGSSSLQPAVPESSFPIHLQRWTLWAPAQYEIDPLQRYDSLQKVPGWKRLFGPLARSRGETVFNPLEGSSWAELWSTLSVGQQRKPLAGAWISSESLAESLNNNRHLPSAGLREVAQRMHLAKDENFLWHPLGATMLADVERRAQTVEFVGQLPALVVRRASVLRAWWYAIVLLTVVLGVWQLAHYPKALLFAAAVAGAACLIMPAPWLTLPQAVFLGLVAAAFVRIARKGSRFGNNPLVNTTRAITTATLLLVCLTVSNRALGQVPITAATTASTSATKQYIPRVLVPVDSQGHRQGEDVYLPERFLKKIQPPPRPAVHDGAELVLLSASYRGSLPGAPEEVASTDLSRFTQPWTLRWKVESYVPNCRLSLPLQRKEATWNASRLDGLPVQLDWHLHGDGCTVTLAETGTHWLELVCQPRFFTDSHGLSDHREATLRLRIPSLPGAKLDLALASNVEVLQIPGAIPVASNEIPNRWQGMLGASETLELHWTWKTVGGRKIAWDRLEQLSWLRIGPATSQLDVQLSVTGYQAESLLLELDVSPQLKLVLPGNDSPIVRVISPSPSQPTRLQLKPGLPADFVIPLHFELQRSASIGHLYFPRVRLVGQSPAQNLFAVSVSAGLSYAEQASSALRRIEPAEFLKSWETSIEQPLYAYVLGQEDPEWSLRVWPDPRFITAQQTLRIHCYPNEARIDFEAVLDELTGSWLSHRVEVPKSLQIDAITVHDHYRDTLETTSIPVRWSRVSATEVVLFFGRPLQHAHRLQLRGHVVAKENEMELPQVRLLSGEQEEIHMDLFRSEEVRVSWVVPQLAPQAIPGQRVPRDQDALFVGHYSWRASQIGKLSRLRLERNGPAFQVLSVTTVDLSQTGWTAQVNSRLQILRGVVSRLKLTAPRGFRMPYLLQPEQVGVIDEVLETADGQEITVTLARPAAAGEEIEVHLRGNLSLPADQRLVVPSLAWNGAAGDTRYVLLPTRVEGQWIRWQTSGLRRQALPPQLRVYSLQEKNTLSYRLEQDQFEAKQQTYQGAMRKASIRYAKVSAFLDAEGLLTATAELVLQPGRATSCTIQLPAESQLRQLIVGDLPIRRDLLKNGRWKLSVGPPFMPQRIVVNYRTKLGPIANRLRLTLPEIFLGDQGLPPPETWWQIRTISDLQLGKPAVGRLTDQRHFMHSSFRLPGLVLKDALTLALELPREEGQAWAETWRTLTRRALRDWQISGYLESDASDIAATQAALRGFAEAFAADGSSPALRPNRLTYPIRLPGDSKVSPARAEYFYVSDPKGRLSLTVSRGPQRNGWRWLTATALVSGVFAILLLLGHYPDWHHHLGQWPHSLAIGSGFAWWMFLKPSVLGMLVLVFALTSLAIKQGRHYSRRRPTKPFNAIPR